MNKVSVVIPCYKAQETIRKTLASIAMQTIADELEVVVANDADGLSYDEILKDFQYLDIHFVVNSENRGCAGARNLGIESATGDHLVFVDADDMFSTPIALEIMRNEITKNEADMLVSTFESEMRLDDGIGVKKIEGSITWMHGKIIRRQFLIDNNIRFRENLRLNEDVEFNQICVDLGAKIVKIPLVSYLWRDNPKSLTHESLFKNKLWFVKAVAEYLKECDERGMSGANVEKRVVQNIVVVYQYANIVADDHPDNFEEYMETCREYYKLAKPIVADLDDKFVTDIFCEVMNGFKYVPIMTFPQFIKELS